MIISNDAIKKILGVNDKIYLTPKQMAKNVCVTYYPYAKINKEILNFKNRLDIVFKQLGVNVVPYNAALVKLRGKYKIKKGIATIVLGECKNEDLALDHVESFKENPIITVVTDRSEASKKLSYRERINRGFDLLTWYGPDLILIISQKLWILYSMNGFSPFYPIEENLKENILFSLIPKIATHVSPLKFEEFEITKLCSKSTLFNNNLVNDIVSSGNIFSETKIFPPMKELSEVKWRSHHYKSIASLFLDKRTGISFGFLARQVPLKLPKMIKYKEFKSLNKKFENKGYLMYRNNLYILLNFNDYYVSEVPKVWVYMSRSGAEKTKLRADKDIIRVGLKGTNLFMEVPDNILLQKDDFKPSFDTRLILSHCVGNAIIGVILKSISNNKAYFPTILEKQGLALCHWHGNIKEEFIPRGWGLHGKNNPPVLCSSPHSAVLALSGKLNSFENLVRRRVEYFGDVQIEPHHGINMTWSTLNEFGKYILSIKEFSR